MRDGNFLERTKNEIIGYIESVKRKTVILHSVSSIYCGKIENMGIKKFDITGMICSSCVAHVEKSVKKLKGVQSVNVQLLTNSMTVTFDDSELKVQTIEDSVKKAGYEARVQVAVSDTNQQKESRRVDIGKAEADSLRKRWWISFGFLLPGSFFSG